MLPIRKSERLEEQRVEWVSERENNFEASEVFCCCCCCCFCLWVSALWWSNVRWEKECEQAKERERTSELKELLALNWAASAVSVVEMQKCNACSSSSSIELSLCELQQVGARCCNRVREKLDLSSLGSSSSSSWRSELLARRLFGVVGKISKLFNVRLRD